MKYLKNKRKRRSKRRSKRNKKFGAKLEPIEDSQGRDIILGKGRQKTVYLGIFTDDNGNSQEVSYTNYPPFNIILGHNKSHVVKYLSKINGNYTMERGILLSSVIIKNLYSNYPQYKQDIFARLMSQMIASAFECAEIGLTSYDVHAEFVIVPSDKYRIKRIDLDFPDRGEKTELELAIQSIFVITQCYDIGIINLSVNSDYTGPNIPELIYTHNLFNWICNLYDIKYNNYKDILEFLDKNIFPKQLWFIDYFSSVKEQLYIDTIKGVEKLDY